MQQGTREEKNCGEVEADVELGLALCGKLTYSAEFECIKSPGDTLNTQSARFESHRTKCREFCHWRFKSKWRSVKFSSVADTDGDFAKKPSTMTRSNSFPEFWDAGCEDCVCSEPSLPEFLLQEKSQSGGTHSSGRRFGSFVEDTSFTWSTTICGILALMIQFLITQSVCQQIASADCFNRLESDRSREPSWR